MPKRFYLSTRKDRSAEAAPLLAALASRGWERTFSWTDMGDAGAEAFAAAAVAELAGVRAADVLIVLLPGGFGTHVEMGAALALGKPVVLCAPDQKALETPYRCLFHYHPLVRRLVSPVLDLDSTVASMDDALAAV